MYTLTKTLVILFGGLCFLRYGPQRVPYSPPLLRNLLGAYGLVAFCTRALIADLGDALNQTLFDIALLIAISWSVLALGQRSPRLVQVLSAQAGTGILLWLLSIPAVMMLVAQDGEGGLGPRLWLHAMIAWDIVIKGHILRHALDIDGWLGLLYSLLLFQLTSILFSLFYALT